MVIEETKRLLQVFHITPNKLLGQNFMVEPSFFPKLSIYASLKPTDVVLDAGAGFGFLTHYLADRCKSVIAVEKDPQIAVVLRDKISSLSNVKIIEGDVLRVFLPQFNKAIAAPPYYLSSKLVLFLLERKVDCGVLIVQKEFADRLVAKVGSEDYSWLTVTVYHKAQVELLDIVPKDMFYPIPEVDSIIMRLKPWETAPFEVKDEWFFEQMVKWLFTERNKKLSNALEPFIRINLKLDKEEYKKLIQVTPFANMRPRELSPENFGAIANAFTN